MSKVWEYKVLVLQTGVVSQTRAAEKWEEELDNLGEEGWELVSVIPMHVHLGVAGSTPQVRCFLKREMKCPKCDYCKEEFELDDSELQTLEEKGSVKVKCPYCRKMVNYKE